MLIDARHGVPNIRRRGAPERDTHRTASVPQTSGNLLKLQLNRQRHDGALAQIHAIGSYNGRVCARLSCVAALGGAPPNAAKRREDRNGTWNRAKPWAQPRKSRSRSRGLQASSSSSARARFTNG